MSFRSSVVSIKCRGSSVVSIKCRSIKCRFDQLSFDQMSFEQLSWHRLPYPRYATEHCNACKKYNNIMLIENL